MSAMMSAQTTKERILNTAEEIMLERSFHSVGLKQILDAVKVPKGSFYHYFESKDQFGVEMMKHYMSDTSSRKRQFLLIPGSESDPLQRLFDYLDESVASIRKSAGKFPCLALKLASEVSDISEAMREELARGFEDWIGIFQEVLDQAVAQQILPEDFDSASEAQLIMDLWSGAIQRAVANRDAAPVNHAVEHIRTRINSMRI